MLVIIPVDKMTMHCQWKWELTPLARLLCLEEKELVKIRLPGGGGAGHQGGLKQLN